MNTVETCSIEIWVNKKIAVDPHSFLADSVPTVFFNADPDPAAFYCGSGSSIKNFVNNYLMKSFL